MIMEENLIPLEDLRSFRGFSLNTETINKVFEIVEKIHEFKRRRKSQRRDTSKINFALEWFIWKFLPTKERKQSLINFLTKKHMPNKVEQRAELYLKWERTFDGN